MEHENENARRRRPEGRAIAPREVPHSTRGPASGSPPTLSLRRLGRRPPPLEIGKEIETDGGGSKPTFLRRTIASSPCRVAIVQSNGRSGDGAGPRTRARGLRAQTSRRCPRSRAHARRGRSVDRRYRPGPVGAEVVLRRPHCDWAASKTWPVWRSSSRSRLAPSSPPTRRFIPAPSAARRTAVGGHDGIRDRLRGQRPRRSPGSPCRASPSSRDRRPPARSPPPRRTCSVCISAPRPGPGRRCRWGIRDSSRCASSCATIATSRRRIENAHRRRPVNWAIASRRRRWPPPDRVRDRSGRGRSDYGGGPAAVAASPRGRGLAHGQLVMASSHSR